MSKDTNTNSAVHEHLPGSVPPFDKDSEVDRSLESSGALASFEHTGTHTHEDRERAARYLQRLWRSRRKRAVPITHPDAKWRDMELQLSAQIAQKAADKGENDPKSRWHRAVFIAGRLRDGESVLPGDADYNKSENGDPSNIDAAAIPREGEHESKILETQHWLELIDGKHRYGSNMKFYHRRWVTEDTTENFFHWLDRGGGKNLSLPECPRTKLESERITYLSAEQRLNYLTKIDTQGRFRWVRNNELVDTTPNRWKDSEGGMGVVPLDGSQDQQVSHRLRRKISTLSGSPSSSSSDDVEENAEHYVGDPTKSKLKKAFTSRFTTKGLTERLMRRTVRKNTWIYVADMKFNIFIGVKETGTFQHSSFTAGGLIASAGLIKLKDGVIRSLSPLSGHYRTSIHHFRSFIEVIDARGADLHKAKISKAEAVLWGLEHWKKFQKSKAAFVKKETAKIKGLAHSNDNKDGEDGISESSEPHLKGMHERDAEEEDKANEQWHTDSKWRGDILVGRVKDAAVKVIPGVHRSIDESGSYDPVKPEDPNHSAEPTPELNAKVAALCTSDVPDAQDPDAHPLNEATLNNSPPRDHAPEPVHKVDPTLSDAVPAVGRSSNLHEGSGPDIR